MKEATWSIPSPAASALGLVVLLRMLLSCPHPSRGAVSQKQSLLITTINT